MTANGVEDRIRALARALTENEVEVCTFGEFALSTARDVLATLNDEGYDVVPMVVGKEKGEAA